MIMNDELKDMLMSIFSNRYELNIREIKRLNIKNRLKYYGYLGDDASLHPPRLQTGDEFLASTSQLV